ncbi:hypothetical protein ACLBWP_13640 [Microbacterium sp. M1A1_1b]
MEPAWDGDEAELRDMAGELRSHLDLDRSLTEIGSVHLVGAGALRVMVARDIDLTVVVAALPDGVVQAVGRLAGRLSEDDRVREVLIRNDTGRWNIDPRYPDGLYLGIQAAGSDGHLWSVDVWFVDDPDRQPDLLHLRTLAPRIDPSTQSRILEIKRAQDWTLPDGSRMPSVEVYRAVIDHGVSGPEAFRLHMGARISQVATP